LFSFFISICSVGERGTGKSVLMNQLVMYARKQGWLCLYVSNGWDQVQSGLFIEPVENESDLYDNFMMTKFVLRSFWKAHHDVLSTLPLKKRTSEEMKSKYSERMEKIIAEWNRSKAMHKGEKDPSFIKIRGLLAENDIIASEDALDEEVLKGFNMETFEIKTLQDLIFIGIAIPEYAGLAFRDLIEELKIIDHIPILVAVDEYNTWFDRTAFMYDDKSISSWQLTVPSCLHVFDRRKEDNSIWKMKNGLAIVASSVGRTEGKKITFDDVNASIPLKIVVPAYNQIEYTSAFTFYSNYSIIEPCFTSDDFLLFRTFTASNPRRISVEAIKYFLPRIFEMNEDNFFNAIADNMMNPGNLRGDDDNEDLPDGGVARNDDEDMEVRELVKKSGGKTGGKKKAVVSKGGKK
jgi:hypothetical protein